MNFCGNSVEFREKVLHDIEAAKICKKHEGNNGGNKRRYIDLVTAFDIETSKDVKEEFSWMYVSMFGTENGNVYFMRTWEEFKGFCEEIQSVLIEKDAWLVCYVHNLPYEFGFLKGIYPFAPEDVFVLSPRKPAKCDLYGRIEMRCSYKLSNMSLSAWTKQLKVTHQKLDGEEYDYTQTRYPDTELTEREQEYCSNDVLGLCECVRTMLTNDGDTLHTIPLTSTGYVRRDVKRALHGRRRYINSLLPSEACYNQLLKAFRGGDTHANRFVVGQILTDVRTKDYSSCYPTAQMFEQFPVQPFSPHRAIDSAWPRILDSGRVALVCTIRMVNVTLKPDRYCPAPYLSRSKCDGEEWSLDNGRVLAASWLETVVTDIDFRIILDEYTFDSITVYDGWVSTYGQLPEEFKNVIKEYWDKKCNLKGDESQEYYYMKSKNKLNSLYGMTAQKPIRDGWLYMDGQFVEGKLKPVTYADEMKKATLPYQWGVWTTAHARNMLRKVINLAGMQHVYNDTDSVKHEDEIDVTEINSYYKKLNQKAGTMHGKYYMGALEEEKTADRFVSLGAKKYAAEYDGELKITISGVRKEDGSEEMGTIENFKPGFRFAASAGTRAVFNDNFYREMRSPQGLDFCVRDNICILDTDYTLGITDEYSALIENCAL